MTKNENIKNFNSENTIPPFNNSRLLMRDYFWIFDVEENDIFSIFNKLINAFQLNTNDYTERMIKKFKGHGFTFIFELPNSEGIVEPLKRWGFQLELTKLKTLGRNLPKDQVITLRSQVNLFSDYVYDQQEKKYICLKPYAKTNRELFNSNLSKLKKMIEPKSTWIIPKKGEYRTDFSDEINNILDLMSEEIDENGFRTCSEREELYLKQENNE